MFFLSLEPVVHHFSVTQKLIVLTSFISFMIFFLLSAFTQTSSWHLCVRNLIDHFSLLVFGMFILIGNCYIFNLCFSNVVISNRTVTSCSWWLSVSVTAVKMKAQWEGTHFAHQKTIFQCSRNPKRCTYKKVQESQPFYFLFSFKKLLYFQKLLVPRHKQAVTDLVPSFFTALRSWAKHRVMVCTHRLELQIADSCLCLSAGFWLDWGLVSGGTLSVQKR